MFKGWVDLFQWRIKMLVNILNKDRVKDIGNKKWFVSLWKSSNTYYAIFV